MKRKKSKNRKKKKGVEGTNKRMRGDRKFERSNKGEGVKRKKRTPEGDTATDTGYSNAFKAGPNVEEVKPGCP